MSKLCVHLTVKFDFHGSKGFSFIFIWGKNGG